MVKAILLDCGGVLMRPLRGHWRLPVNYEELFGDYRRFDPDKVAEAMKKHEFLLDEGQKVTTLKHEYDLRVLYTRRMADELGLALTDEAVRAIAESLTYRFERYHLYDDTVPMLAKWQSGGKKVGFVSNAMPSMVRALEQYDFYDKMDCSVVSCMIGKQKPGSDIFTFALDELHLPANECVFLDDLSKNLTRAKIMGFKTIRMRRTPYTIEPAEDFEWEYTAHDLSEADAIIETL